VSPGANSAGHVSEPRAAGMRGDDMSTVTQPAQQAVRGYSPPDEERPLGGYVALTSTFALAIGGALAALRASGAELPDRPSGSDLVLTGIATHKISRLLTKDKVTSFARAPFTRFQEPAGHGELEEEPRGHGLRHAIGELLVCPYCVAQWVAAAFAVGLVAAPRPTRFVAGIYVTETVSDFLQLAYKAAEDRA
jgi:Protein of unknown function (DUF1360)